MNINECVSKGLLKQEKPDGQKALASLETAARKIQLAEAEINAEIYENALTTAYTAFFHTARALLYKDGFKERSHYALSVYVNEKYGDKIEQRFLTELDALRETRHLIMYGINRPPNANQEEARHAVDTAKEFLAAVKKLLE